MPNAYADRRYTIFNVSELNKINFSEVIETSEETVRKSADGTKTLVKWETDDPPLCLQNITSKEGPYTYAEILEILDTPEWATSL